MKFFGKSDVGLMRTANQDSYEIRGICKNATLAVVCDGMGGAKSGNVASEYALEVFTEYVLKYCEKRVNEDGILSLDSDGACEVLDRAVSELASMPCGNVADRESVTSAWEICKK